MERLFSLLRVARCDVRGNMASFGRRKEMEHFKKKIKTTILDSNVILPKIFRDKILGEWRLFVLRAVQRKHLHISIVLNIWWKTVMETPLLSQFLPIKVCFFFLSSGARARSSTCSIGSLEWWKSFWLAPTLGDLCPAERDHGITRNYSRAKWTPQARWPLARVKGCHIPEWDLWCIFSLALAVYGWISDTI